MFWNCRSEQSGAAGQLVALATGCDRVYLLLGACWVDVDQPDDCFVHLVLCCIAVKVSSCFVCHDNAQMLACQQHLLELDNVHMAEASLQLDLTPDLLRAKTQVFAPAYDE